MGLLSINENIWNEIYRLFGASTIMMGPPKLKIIIIIRYIQVNLPESVNVWLHRYWELRFWVKN